MFDFIKGKIIELTPSYVVLLNSDIGYFINISLQTYSALNNLSEAKLYIHTDLKENEINLFGFFRKEEREIFRLLISVSGVGVNTARLMLSALSVDDIQKAIIENDVNLLKSVKGIGLKTAQRIIVDLKDKLSKSKDVEIFQQTDIINEAIQALVALGFSKKISEQKVRKVFKDNPNLNLENLIKQTLKLLTN